MDSQVLRSKPRGARPSEVIEPIVDDLEYQIFEEKVDLEIRKMLRIKPADLDQVMRSFAVWAKQWETTKK
jgi:hypothetical protein